MLVLTRKVGQTITIGHNIRITIMDIRVGQVKLGVDAPPNVTIHREEIHEKIQQQNVAAARSLLSELQAASQAWREKSEEDGSKDNY